MERQKLLIIGAVAAAVVIAILAFGLKREGPRLRPITLEIWSVYDDRDFYREVIEDYQRSNRHITIEFQKKSFDIYEEDLINALAAGKGPDIFNIHNTWLPKHKDKISPMPQGEGFITLEEFSNTFVDVAYFDFIAKEEAEEETRTSRGIPGRRKDEEEAKERIYALPLYVDTLALYYNKDTFNSVGIPSPPAICEELLDDVYLLTEKDQWGNIKKSGIAMGTAENINRSTDILAFLMLQSGAEMTNEDRTKATFGQAIRQEEERFNPGKDALRFYTDFSNPSKNIYCWNRQMPYSIDAFYQGKAAMMINYSYAIETIRAKSPYLNFAIALVPQIKDRKFDVNYANYWGYTVFRDSEESESAWRFLQFLSSEKSAKKYLENTKRPTARRDLISWQKEDSELSAFANQVLSAKSWYQADSQTIEEIFINMVESIVLGKATLDQALKEAVDKVNVLMK